MQDQSSETRTCRECGVEKPAGAFCASRNGRPWCKQCMWAYEQVRRKQFAIAHPDAPKPEPMALRVSAVCRGCGVEKPGVEFSTHWRQRRCKACTARAEAARRLRHGYPTRKVPETFADGTCRRCTRCREIKPMSEFPRHKPTARKKTSSTGRLSHCKACNRAKTKAWREANPERARAGVRAAWEANGERYSRGSLAWARANRDKTRLYKQRRRATKMGVGMDPFTSADWQQLQELFGHRCAYCWAQPKQLTQDHIQPLTRGGSHTITNIVPACRSCNSRKNTKSLLEFLLYRSHIAAHKAASVVTRVELRAFP